MILHVFIWNFCIFLQKYLSYDRADIQSGKHYYSKIINKKSRDKYFICQKKHDNKISKKNTGKREKYIIYILKWENKE